MKDLYIMGLCYSHDASACLLKNWIPLVAIQKERITRKKHDGAIQNINLDDCIQYCFDAAGIELWDIELFVENSPTILYCKEKDTILWFNKKRLLETIAKDKIIQISHHVAHAFAAYWSSPFQESAVLIIDGQWNYYEDITEDLSWAKIFPEYIESSYIERESFYEFTGNNYTTLRKNLSTIHKSFTKICGLGHMYETVSSYVFKSRHDAGKLMWLAPYGQDVYDFKMINLLPSWEISYTTEWIRQFTTPNINGTLLETHWDQYRNLAYTTQSELENGITFLVKRLREQSKKENLCYSGWVSLNCSSNNLIKFDGWFKNLFITPAASDAGISLWCAYYGYLSLQKQPKKIYEYSDYLGKEYSDQEIEDALLSYKEQITYKKSENIYKEVASLIAEGKIIGWFQWKSEFGPRALWNRSIIADPRNKNMPDILNKQVKFREAFRPFAPSVMEEHADKFFDIDNSPYMLLTAQVQEEKKHIIPAVTHVDWTSRIQTVNAQQNPKYHKMIEAFYDLTGVPLVVNTSFNIINEPIVETPKDAIRCFLGTGIDYLAIGEYIVRK